MYLPSVQRAGSLLLAFIFLIALQNFTPAQAEDYDALKLQAATLVQKHNITDAFPILEKLIKLNPNDADVQFMYGFSLLAKSAETKDADLQRQMTIRARNAFLRSKQLGNTEPVLDALIASIPVEGAVDTGRNAFSKSNEAETMMKEAEGYFAKGQFDEAIAAYQKALKLDPNIYEAALYSGDAYKQKENFEQAEVWYQKAIAIDPSRETAYRYSATPLMIQKKYDQARDRYIEAFITEPYSRFSSAGLGNWAQATGAVLGHPRIDIPASVGKGSTGNTTIALGMGDSDNGSFAWTAYGLSRALWVGGETGLSEKFKKAYPNEKEYRHSLAEEYEALKLAVSTLKTRMKEKDNPVKKLHPQLEVLIKLADDGMLEPFIIISMPDRGIVQDHAAYLKQNREKMKQYVLKYLIRK